MCVVLLQGTCTLCVAFTLAYTTGNWHPWTLYTCCLSRTIYNICVLSAKAPAVGLGSVGLGQVISPTWDRAFTNVKNFPFCSGVFLEDDVV